MFLLDPSSISSLILQFGQQTRGEKRKIQKIRSELFPSSDTEGASSVTEMGLGSGVNNGLGRHGDIPASPSSFCGRVVKSL